MDEEMSCGYNNVEMVRKETLPTYMAVYATFPHMAAPITLAVIHLLDKN